MKKINGTKAASKLLELILDPRTFTHDTSKNIEGAIEKINPLIQQDGYKIEVIEGRTKIVGEGIGDEIAVEIHFEQIQSQIIAHIREAKYLIWVAVGWFTDKVLARELFKKKEAGINVQIIIIDDEINRKYGVDFETHFDILRVPPKGKYENIMHHKFCIIDLNIVIHGSYNWTNRARYNNETISIDCGRENAEKFASEFIELKK